MEYLKEIINGLLIESANIGSVSTAIRQRKEAEIYYEADDDAKGTGKRVIQPVAIGLSKAGNMVLRAFQPYGDTKTKVPHWKMFRLDKIKTWKTLWKRTFDEPPAQYSAEGEFNDKGDKSMSEVYLVANFENSRRFKKGEVGQGLMRYNKNRQQQAAEKNPLYKLQQNIKNATTDNDITNRINKYRSDAASDYVNGNDKYLDDLNSVKNDADITPQTNDAIEKDSYKYNKNYNDREAVHVQNNGPVSK